MEINGVWIPLTKTPCGDDPYPFTDRHYGYRDRKALKEVSALCRNFCEERVECLTAAMAVERGMPARERFGIRGGLTPLQRFNLERGKNLTYGQPA